MATRKKVLVTGAKGMLGTDLVARIKMTRKYDLVAVDIEEMDITRLSEVKNTLLEHRPDVVIHCAAYTNVDRAENERELAMAVNSEGTKHVAFFCREIGAEMIYISTDYVFDGVKQTPYVETDRTHPINVYGASKLAGEEHVAVLLEKHKICRTSWLCGVHGHNFIYSILQAVSEGRPLSVVNDQIGRPTFTFDLAEALLWLLDRPQYGVFHITNSGFCSWYEFAQKIIHLGGIKDVAVRPITSEQFRSLARRPPYSVLENRRLEQLGFRPLPRWEDSLREFLARKTALEQSGVPPVVARRGTSK
ncbi:MAG: dTDP-4-dehydrorhamnose reductase [Candidatus Sumerlaeia bacterium]|nr:dTDP-4-dehydrorhamnose reductase [Candidatus Sumerlaeia bacterium]